MSVISVHDNFLSENEQHDILTYLQKPIFSGTQTSTGNTTGQRIFFRADLETVDLFLELISKITPLLPQHNYKLVRCWAIAHQSGSHGDIHQDVDGDISVIVYPHNAWHVNWGGETIFFDSEKYDIVKSVLPVPFRAVVFESNIYHCARPTTSHFLGIRYVINYLFKRI
jgi:Rps23 Pro-64 3,4-dihydroxylase Tpa1-like proline 4-hydroxylase